MEIAYNKADVRPANWLILRKIIEAIDKQLASQMPDYFEQYLKNPVMHGLSEKIGIHIADLFIPGDSLKNWND